MNKSATGGLSTGTRTRDRITNRRNRAAIRRHNLYSSWYWPHPPTRPGFFLYKKIIKALLRNGNWTHSFRAGRWCAVRAALGPRPRNRWRVERAWKTDDPLLPSWESVKDVRALLRGSFVRRCSALHRLYFRFPSSRRLLVQPPLRVRRTTP